MFKIYIIRTKFWTRFGLGDKFIILILMERMLHSGIYLTSLGAEFAIMAIRILPSFLSSVSSTATLFQ